MEIKNARTMVAVALIFFGLLGIVYGNQVLSTEGLPFRGEFTLGDSQYTFDGIAVLIGTVTPGITPSVIPPTDTPVTPEPPTVTPEPPTVTPIPPTPVPPGDDLDVGTHGWGYALPVMVAHPQDNALISVLVPTMMREAGYTYADLVAAVGYAGPCESKIDGVRRYALNMAGANVLGYVPEGQTTSPSVPYSETVYLEQYLAEFIAIGQAAGITLNYGPSLELITIPGTWRYHQAYDLDNERVSNLAAMLPDNSFWSLRVNTPEHMYEDDAAGFRGAIAELVDAIHAGNPTTRIIMHLSLPPETEDQFMFYVDAARGLVNQVYAGIDYPFPSDPYYDEEGTIAALIAVLERTGAGSVVPPTVLPPTSTPDAPTVTPEPPVVQSYYDLPYGPDPAHKLDLFVPSSCTASHPCPVIGWWHGGGLSSGDKSQQTAKCLELAAEGFAMAAPNYRLTVNGFYLPTQVYDAKAVIRWLRANAAQYNLDPARVGAIGGSAGAFLSTHLGSSSGEPEMEGDVGGNLGYSSEVQASFGIAGVYNFRSLFRNQIGYCEGLDPVAEIAACFQDGDSTGKGDFFHCYLNQPACLYKVDISSAYYWLSAGDPPSAVLIGTLDPTPYGIEDHTAYHEKALSLGIDSTLIIMEGYEHLGTWPDDKPYIVGFFKTHLMAIAD